MSYPTKFIKKNVIPYLQKTKHPKNENNDHPPQSKSIPNIPINFLKLFSNKKSESVVAFLKDLHRSGISWNNKGLVTSPILGFPPTKKLTNIFELTRYLFKGDCSVINVRYFLQFIKNNGIKPTNISKKAESRLNKLRPVQ